jgi:hypothetical protein
MGFTTDGLVMADLSAPTAMYPVGSPETATLLEDLSTAMKALPGVQGAGATTVSPLSEEILSYGVHVPGREPDPGNPLFTLYRSVTPGFFDVMGIPVLAGRLFTGEDIPPPALGSGRDSYGPEPAVISASLARTFWSVDEAPGNSLMLWGRDGRARKITIQGVVPDIRDLTFPHEPIPQVFLPPRYRATPNFTLVIQVRGDPEGTIARVPNTVRSVDPSVAVTEIRAGDEILAQFVAGPRLTLRLMEIFSLSALLLAGVGVAGITAVAVARRTPEIGIRMAVGAPRGRVLTTVVKESQRLVVAGVGLGMLAAISFAGSLDYVFPGIVLARIPWYLAAGLLVLIVGLAAALVPARRALLIDPARTLQAE